MSKLYSLTFGILMLVLVPQTVISDDSIEVLRSFDQGDEVSDIVRIEEKEKHQILFIMGVSLLLLLIVTVSLGIAMGVFGKQLFLAHMICAGLSMTLALAHSVVAIVWFFPF